MKFKYLFIAVLAGAALVGCNKEKGGPDNGSDQIKDAKYMGFTISVPTATKAEGTGDTGSYEVGADYENWINTIHFLFYKDGAYVSWGYGNLKNDFVIPNTSPEASTGNVEEILHDGTTLKKGVVILESTMAMPNQALCVINTRNIDFYRNKPLAQVLEALASGKKESVTGKEWGTAELTQKDFWYYYNDKPYFVMVTSPMYGKNKAGQVEIKYTTDISENDIYDDISSAQANPVDVFVERQAARLEISNLNTILDGEYVGINNLGDAMKSGTEPIYDIKPIAWGVTAANKTSKALKSVDITWWGQTGANQPFYGGWLESGDKINNVYHAGDANKMFTRINWAKDANYKGQPAATNRGKYPHSARELLTESEFVYYSAKEIKDHYDEPTDGKLNDILQRYAYENTFGYDVLKDNDPRIVGTMLLLYAQAKKHGAANFEDLYAYMGQIYSFQQYAEHLFSVLDANGFTFYINEGGFKKVSSALSGPTPLKNAKDLAKTVKATKITNFFSQNAASYQDLSATFSSVDPSKKLSELYSDWVIDLSATLQPNKVDPRDGDKGFIEVPSLSNEKGYADGYVTIIPQVTLYVSDKTATNPSYDAGVPDSEYRPITEKEKVEAFLGNVVEPANRYDEGRMYYAIPIEHFGKAKTAGTDPELLEGNYGVVRNNFYKVNIRNINSLGHGIDDVNEPIVPGDRKKPFYLAAKINILSWQIAEQTADLQE